MKKILYLSYTGLTEPLGQSQVLAYLQGLSRTGRYQFTVVSFERPGLFEKGKEGIATTCAAHDILWHPLVYEKKHPALAILKRLRTIKRLVHDLHKTHRYDIVHCRSYRAASIGLWMKERYGVKFLFDMRGFWADERIDGGVWKLKNPVHNLLYRYYKQMEKTLLCNADHIISLTENAKGEINSWRLAPAPFNITVIPCCVDLDLFNPAKTNEDEQAALRMQLQLKETDLVVSYLGSLGTWYLLDEMLQFFSVWLQQMPDAVLLFITNEPAASIRLKAAQHAIPEASLRVTSVPRASVPLALSLSHCSLFFIKPSFSKKASSPVKQGEIMAMGIPVICNDGVGDTAAIVRRFKAGYMVQTLEAKHYPEDIRRFCSMPFDRAAIRSGAAEFFSLDKGVQLYDQVYQTF